MLPAQGMPPGALEASASIRARQPWRPAHTSPRHTGPGPSNTSPRPPRTSVLLALSPGKHRFPALPFPGRPPAVGSDTRAPPRGPLLTVRRASMATGSTPLSYAQGIKSTCMPFITDQGSAAASPRPHRTHGVQCLSRIQEGREYREEKGIAHKRGNQIKNDIKKIGDRRGNTSSSNSL